MQPELLLGLPELLVLSELELSELLELGLELLDRLLLEGSLDCELELEDSRDEDD